MLCCSKRLTRMIWEMSHCCVIGCVVSEQKNYKGRGTVSKRIGKNQNITLAKSIDDIEESKMAYFQILSLLTAVTSVVALAGTPNVYAGTRRGSCYGEASVDDTCCYLSPARLLQTQVWDTRPVSGPLGKLRLQHNLSIIANISRLMDNSRTVAHQQRRFHPKQLRHQPHIHKHHTNSISRRR